MTLRAAFEREIRLETVYRVKGLPTRYARYHQNKATWYRVQLKRGARRRLDGRGARRRLVVWNRGGGN